MSRASGMVQFEDGIILYCIYNGTCDIMDDQLFDTTKEAWDNYYGVEFSYNSQCSCDGEDVLIYTDYGMGETYTGKACKKHKCIIFDFNNFMECARNMEMGWLYRNLTKEQIEQEEKEYEETIKNNWAKRGKHFKSIKQ